MHGASALEEWHSMTIQLRAEVSMVTQMTTIAAMQQSNVLGYICTV